MAVLKKLGWTAICVRTSREPARTADAPARRGERQLEPAAPDAYQKTEKEADERGNHDRHLLRLARRAAAQRLRLRLALCCEASEQQSECDRHADLPSSSIRGMSRSLRTSTPRWQRLKFDNVNHPRVDGQPATASPKRKRCRWRRHVQAAPPQDRQWSPPAPSHAAIRRRGQAR